MATSDDTVDRPLVSSLVRDIAWIAAVALVYYAAARLSLRLVVAPEGIAAIWPPEGIFLSALLLIRRERRMNLAAALFLTDLVAELQAGTPPVVSVAYSAALTASAGVSALILLRVFRGRVTFSRVSEVFGFLFIAVLGVNAIASLVAAGASTLIPGTHFWTSWFWWAASDGVGNLIVTPLVISWSVAIAGRRLPSIREGVESAVVFAGLAVAGYYAFAYSAATGGITLVIAFTAFPFLLWASLRLGTHIVTTGIVISAAMAIGAVVAGSVYALDVGGSAPTALMVVQFYVAVMAVPSLVLAASVTERERAMATLRESEMRQQRMVAEAPIPMIVHAEDGEVLQLSRTWQDLSGFGADRIRHTTDWTALAYSAKEGAVVQDDIDALYAIEERTEEGEYTFLTADGEERTWDFSSSPLGRLPDGRRAIISSAKDVTERKRAEKKLTDYQQHLEALVEQRTAELADANEELAATNEELVSTNEELTVMNRELLAANTDLDQARGELVDANSAKDLFLASMSHELRTPLNSIIGFSGVMLAGLAGELNGEQTRQVRMISASGRHLLELINEVLDLSKIESGQTSLVLEDVDLAALVQAVVDSLGPSAREKGIDLIGDVEPGIARMTTDRVRLEQVLINLVGNAVKFTDAGEVRVTAADDGASVVLAVADTGHGIERSERSRIFEDFYQVHQPGTAKSEGTGLGLPVSKRLVEALGGTIGVESEPGAGSTFTVRLPKGGSAGPDPEPPRP